MAFSQTDRERLARLLAMFSSDYDGEVVNAARAAERLVKSAGVTWHDVLATTFAPGPPPYREPPQRKQWNDRKVSPHQREAAQMLEKRHLLTQFEIDFLSSILGRDFLTERQEPIFQRIRAKMASYANMTW